MRADILTIFPGFFRGPLDHGITRRACEMGLVELQVHDLREFRVAGRVKQSIVLLSAQGQRFNQEVAANLAALDRIVLICGRYEGVDERVADFLADRELSIGDYVLSGGEM